jgi:hypothetical protein
MAELIADLYHFPDGFPQVTTGILIDENTLISGHQNGFVVKWDIKSGNYAILFQGNSSVTTMSANENKNKIAVGYHSGGLYIVELSEKNHLIHTLRQSKFTINSRVWRVLWVDDKNILLTSTYGELTPFKEVNGNWNEEFFQLKGHMHSIFGIAGINGRYIATGDYMGVILLWKFDGNRYNIIQKLGVLGTVQDIFWQDEQRFSVITKSGRMYVIEREARDVEKWQKVLEVNVAEDKGVSVEIDKEGKFVFAGTLSRLIKFDLDAYQSEIFMLNRVTNIFPDGNRTIVLDRDGLHVIQNTPVEIQTNVISYKFVKVSLLGYTGTGKTTFCSNLVNGSIDNIYSTFGKRIFTWKVGGTGIDEKIFFHDHGGQETQLDTFIPQVMDSDIILIFYKKTDNATFSKAVEILKQIRKKMGNNIPVYFMETFIDHELDDITAGSREELLDKNAINGIVKLSPKANTGFNDFEKMVLNNINWTKARKMVQSPYIQGISIALTLLHNKKYDVVLFDIFKQIYQDQVIGGKISERHLKFLLEDYSNQGIIEYYPRISDLIILDDKQFNKMRTDIPKFAAEQGGAITTEQLLAAFKNEEYLHILDEMYSQSGVTIRNGNIRIFPRMLADTITIPKSFEEKFTDVEEKSIYIDYQDIEISRLLEQFSELNLQCINIAKKEGLFAWEDNAFIYYFFQEDRKSVFKKYIKFSYCIGGSKDKFIERLRKEFLACVERAYGPLVELTDAIESDKKKVQQYEFDVALSFAGEQREYVEKIANILKGKGLEVFYDKFKQSQLWGKNLVDYFKQVYYSRSKFCIMFISSDYLNKMWPAHERRNATARDLEEFGEYILPIIFEDNLAVPGLDKYRGYLDARKYTAQQVADIFIEKLSNEEA